MNIDAAIKSIYKPKYTNIAENPDLRSKFGVKDEKEPVDSFLYGKQNHKCEAHCHSKYCSKLKDIDLAEI